MILNSIIIEQAVQNLMEKINIANNVNWRSKPECDLLKELTLCILSSSIKYEVALLYTVKLDKSNYFVKAINNKLNEEQILNCLTEPITMSGKSIRYRFPKIRSSQLSKTINNIYENGDTIKRLLNKTNSSIEARDLFVSICSGIGYKQASMFLRNIGFGYDLAIIDTHIIDYLKLVNVIPLYMNVRSKSVYSKIENLYSEYAQSKQFDIKKLDVAIWNVMKIYKMEFA
jgi:N-glycosylase/DNA lyase